MGNEQGNVQVETFKMQDWQLNDRLDNCKVWRNRRDPSQRIEQYSIYSSNDEEHKNQEDMYIFRKNHPHIVAAYFFESTSQTQFCSSSHTQKIFIEKIPIRLSDIQHIPFPDFLHIYSQALQGFQSLSHYPNIGFFPVEEEYVGINEKGVAKVWMNQNYSKNYYIGTKVSEEFMVNSIVQIIEKNIDHNKTPKHIPSVRNYLYRNTDKLRFEQAKQQFHNYLTEYNIANVPYKLQCIDQVGGISAIQNRDKDVKINRNVASSNTSRIIQIERLEINKNRPQLIDSQILNSQFPIILTPRLDAPQHYYQVPSERSIPLSNSQVVPNFKSNIISPAIIRQNTPIVRKSTPTYYQPISQFNNNPIYPHHHQQQINSQSNKSSSVKIQSNSLFSKQKSNYPVLPIKQVMIAANEVNQNSYINRSHSVQRPTNIIFRQENEVVKKSFIDLVQPQKTTHVQSIHQNFRSTNTIYSHQEGSLRNINPQSAYQMPSRSPTSSFYRPTQRRPNSSYLQFNKEVVSHSIKKSLDDQSISNTKPQVVEVNQWQQKMNQFANKYSNTKTQEVQFENKSKDLNDANNTASGYSVAAFRQNNKSIAKQSQYTTIDMDDGKSSIDFLKKLQQFKKFSPDINAPEAKPESFFSNTRQMMNLDSNLLTKQANSLQNLHSTEQFGRNAVSNIITNQSGVLHQPKIFDNTPLKFENNLDMKYSMFKQDSPEVSYGGYMNKNYQPQMDADIYADLNKLKGKQ